MAIPPGRGSGPPPPVPYPCVGVPVPLPHRGPVTASEIPQRVAGQRVPGIPRGPLFPGGNNPVTAETRASYGLAGFVTVLPLKLQYKHFAFPWILWASSTFMT